MLLWPFEAYADNKLYRDDKTEIRYHLNNPDADNLLVVFQGSDCNSVRHMSSVKTIWQVLAPDAALLTVEKYGIDENLSYVQGERDDCPASYLEHDSMAQRIKDGVRVIKALQDSYDEVTLVGGSEGGSIALAVAAQVTGLHAVLALNSGSSSFQHDIEYSIRKTLPDSARESVLQGFRQFAEQIAASQQAFPIEVSGHGYAFWKDALTRDLIAPLHDINAPVLIMQSAEDKSVDPEMTQAEVASIIGNGASNVKFKMLPGLNHGFRDTTGTSKLSAVVAEAAAILEGVDGE